MPGGNSPLLFKDSKMDWKSTTSDKSTARGFFFLNLNTMSGINIVSVVKPGMRRKYKYKQQKDAYKMVSLYKICIYICVYIYL